MNIEVILVINFKRLMAQNIILKIIKETSLSSDGKF